MLRNLSIRNYTLIDSLDLDIEGGLTVITGETGAGKSIVLDALGLALGNRADSRALRAGAERLEVSVQFDLGGTPGAEAWLRERELDREGECQLRRVVTRDGRSRAWINGQAATLQDLKTLGDQLVDMHGQHEHHSLLSRANHQLLLDEYGGHTALAHDLRTAFTAWRDCRDEHAALQASATERQDRLQLLNYQLGELQELGLGEQETEQLEQQQLMLANAEELSSRLATVLALCEDEESGGALPALRRVTHLADGIEDLGARAVDALQMLESARIQVDEARRELESVAETIEINPARLARVETRLSAIYQLARKHRIEPAALPELQARLAAEARSIEVSDTRIGELNARLQALAADWQAQAKKLSAARRKCAKDISLRVREQLAFLGMEACRFEVAIRANAQDTPNVHGAEQLEFLVATNPGASPEPLARIASGGELSRISLAIQVIAASRATTPTVIFDEVDVGIGGATADAVGSLLQSLGERIQVLCVTHLPQVAARGAQHLRAVKNLADEATSAELHPLDEPLRIAELARMLGGKTITAKTRAHAREMLDTALGVTQV